jgi:hypothetical protein
MKKATRAEQILQIFVENLKINGSFMCWEEIAEKFGGEGYMKKTAPILIEMVKNTMGLVRELADENGYLLIPKRKPTRNDRDKRFIIEGWKIAVAGFDDQYVDDELMYKLQNGQARTNSFKKLAESAHKKGMLGDNRFNELTM